MGEAAWLSIFGLGKASTRKHIRSDLRPRSNATQVKKRRHPQGKSTSRRLAALLAPYPAAAGRVCASLAPCQPPRLLLRGLLLFMRWLQVISAFALVDHSPPIKRKRRFLF